jgi:hypothetical protein
VTPHQTGDPMAGCDPVVTESIQLGTTAARVLDVLRDAEAYPSWVIGTRRVVTVDPSWPAPDATFTHEFGVGPAVGHDQTRVVRFDEDDGVVTLEARGRPAGRAMVHIHVTDCGPRSVVTLTEGPLSGPARWVPSVITAPMLSLRNKLSLRRLRRIAEGGSPSNGRGRGNREKT